MKLLTTKGYLLLIDEEVEIKKGDAVVYSYEIEEPCDKDNLKSNTRYKIIAYYPLSSEAKELDLPLLPDFDRETINVESIAKKWFLINSYNQDGMILSNRANSDYITNKNLFIEGYKAAQAKQFSLEDVVELVQSLTSTPSYISKESAIHQVENYLQSLSTQQLPKEFVPEYKEVTCGCDSIPHNVIRTITNSEGKKELVGTYKY